MAGLLFPLFAARQGNSADSFRTTTRNGVWTIDGKWGLQKRNMTLIFKPSGECLTIRERTAPRCFPHASIGRSRKPEKTRLRVARVGLDWLVCYRCVDYKRMIVAVRFLALPARCVADKCAVFGRPPIRRMRYLRACPAVTRFAIVFAGRPLSKNHGCCPDAAGFNAPKSWADVFHGSPPVRALRT